jgi:hypothetical protein
MPTRLISWQQLVQEADPDWQREKSRPVMFRFSNGRQFTWTPAAYQGTMFLSDDLGRLILDDRGNAIPL